MLDRLAFYGSLRRGCYNHQRMFDSPEGGACYIDTIRLSGFKMIDLGYYPAVYHSQGEITVELYRIPDEYLRRRIDGMELGAGYKKTTFCRGGHEYLLYIITPPSLFGKKYADIMSGDWVSYQNITHNTINGSTLRNIEK